MLNPLTTNDADMCQETITLRHFRQCPWVISSARAERMGQREVCGSTQRLRTAWQCLWAWVA